MGGCEGGLEEGSEGRRGDGRGIGGLKHLYFLVGLECRVIEVVVRRAEDDRGIRFRSMEVCRYTIFDAEQAVDIWPEMN